ncbi:hypothetical protein CDL15_Pgr003080 [Punica granatum]|uniref:Mitochondrial fission 1 protein n=1 Tax=Punica granatum TaxID=22663 RepID=A0A218X2F3_PUNGR|nr:hypothetical protein CDL15_Pgr003080 [Punica granatum]
MAAKIGQFFDSVGSFFKGDDRIPWCDPDIILGCERDVAEAANGGSDELKSESIMRLSWALVHSRREEDVQRGIAMLEEVVNIPKAGSLCSDVWRFTETFRLLELIAPDWRQALTLKKAVEGKVTKDGVIGIGIAATAVGLVAGGIAAALARKK